MPELTNRIRSYWIVALIFGGLSVMASIVAGIVCLVFVVPQQDPATGGLIAICTLALVMGLALIACAVQGLRQRPGRLLYSGYSWALWLCLGGGLLLLGRLLPVEVHVHWAFGIIHMLATVCASMLVISLVARFTGRTSSLNWRQAIVGIIGGASGIWLALPIELIGMLISAGIVMVIAALIPGGNAEVQRLVTMLQSVPGILVTDDALLLESLLQSLLQSPLVMGILGLTMSVFTPLVEELGKVMVLVFVWKADQNTTSRLDAGGRLARAFMWGAVCGLGFAIVEGVATGSDAIGAQGLWVEGILVRMLATIMHVFVSGLVGLGWGLAREYKWWWLPLFYGVAVTLHGIWNANALLMIEVSLIEAEAATVGQILGVAGIVIQVILSLLAFSSILAIPYVLQKRARETRLAGEAQ